MEAKKTPKADLEGKKTLFLEIGMTFALLVALAAFNWKSYEKQEAVFTQAAVMETPEDVIIQTAENTPPPPPPEPSQPHADLDTRFNAGIPYPNVYPKD